MDAVCDDSDFSFVFQPVENFYRVINENDGFRKRLEVTATCHDWISVQSMEREGFSEALYFEVVFSRLALLKESPEFPILNLVSRKQWVRYGDWEWREASLKRELLRGFEIEKGVIQIEQE